LFPADDPSAPAATADQAPVDSDHPTHTIEPGDRPDDSSGATRPSAALRPTGTYPGTLTAPLSVPTGSTDRYELHDAIARGGMGEVFAARDRSLNREVAIKVLRLDLREHPRTASRFIDEARITGQLQHPGIPPVHDLGTLTDGRPFIAMKLIKGQTLADILAGEQPDPSRLLAVFEQIAQTIAYAHNRRVIHRDLKPANIMVGAFGEVQVMDWGLAKVFGESGRLGLERTQAEDSDGMDITAPVTEIYTSRDPGVVTRAGSIMGTPAFMPPEQAIGAVDQIDARSDVFGLGAILCVILTGKPPYLGSDAESTRQLAARGKLEDAYTRLAACGADPELVSLCVKCMAVEKDDRPSDGGEVAEAVASLRAAAIERAKRAELDRVRAEGDLRAAEVKAAEGRKRRRVQLALALTGVLSLFGVGAGAWWQDKQATERKAEKERLEQKQQAELARIDAERQADALRQQVEKERQAQIEKDRLARNAQAIELLLDQAEAALRDDDSWRAAIPLNLAERRAVEGGADHLANRLARCRLDHQTSLDLDQADELHWALEGGERPPGEAQKVWAAAFKKFGIVPGTTNLTEAVRRVNESVIRERLLLGLDRWYAAAPTPEVRKILTTLDPDEFREHTRIGISRSSRALLQQLARDPRALQQPVRFAAVLGENPQIGLDAREAILLPTVRKYPGDISLLLTVTAMYELNRDDTRDTVAQQFRWAQAAVAVRPNSKISWRHLGRAYWEQNTPSEAVECYMKAHELDPDDPYTNTTLAAALVRRGRPAEALPYAHKAIELVPTYALAHNNLAVVLERLNDMGGALREFRLAVEYDPDFALAHYNMGAACLRRGDTDGAIRACREALRVSPNYPQALTTLTRAIRMRDERNSRIAPPPREKK
jgi:tetratricopeptide (TPR) repeat protein/tRNA A-37 threonylcarbamoyl transferase component Bud32